MTVLFWFCFFMIFYTYVGYPMLLAILSLVRPQRVQQGPNSPKMSVILSIHNEEKSIEQKILNLLSLDYPEEKIELLVGSDGSSDQTDAIVSRIQSSRVRFLRFAVNRGKPSVLNDLVKEATGEILVFTDARQEMAKDALRLLVENFQDPKVGCVSGELCFREGGDASVGRGMKLYWNYEKFLRRKEAEMGSMLGATGAIYAIRRDLFSELPADTLVDDMYIPFIIIRKGFRAVFDSRAKAYDRVSLRGEEEFKRKVRTLAGNFQVLGHFLDLLNPRTSPIAIQLISHKLLRLAVPFFLIGIFIANGFLLRSFYFSFFYFFQILMYGTAILEAYAENTGRRFQKLGLLYRIAAISYPFCVLNMAALAGLVQYVTKQYRVTWEKAYV